MGMEAFAERARRELLATGATVRKRAVATLDELTPPVAATGPSKLSASASSATRVSPAWLAIRSAVRR